MSFSLQTGSGRWLLLTVLLALVGLPGCGSATGSVQGKVSYKGKLLKGGNVTFVGAAGKRTVVARIAEDGGYLLEQVPVGTATVCVETKSLDPAKLKKVPTYAAPPNAPGGYNPVRADTSKLYVPIPEKYADPAQSGLTCEVKGGGSVQVHDIELP